MAAVRKVLDVELRDYLRILWSRRWLIVLCLAVAAGSALGFSARITPKYAATAKVNVGPRAVQQNNAADVLAEVTVGQQYVTTYAEILKSRPLAEKVVQKTAAPISPTELSKRTSTKVLPDTRLIEVTVTDPSPSRAQQYVNLLVTSFVENENNQFGGGAPVSASVLETALKPTEPVSPKPAQNAVIGGLLGLMLGVGMAFLLEQLDTTIKTKEDAERALAPLPVIATIPLAPMAREGSIFMEGDANSPQAEAIRILRTNIQFFSVDQPIRRVLVTSPFAGDGKTTIAGNLAAGMAALGSTVLLIETDLRKPVFGRYFDVQKATGLTDVLSGKTTLSEAIIRSRIPNLSVLAAGPIPPNPSELLGSERMADVLDQASGMADILVLDTPPSLPVTDAAVLGPITDGVILVIRAGQTHTHKALDAVNNFQRLGVRVLGIALNGVERETDGGYYYHYTYGRRPEDSPDVGRKKPRDLRQAAPPDFDDLVVSNVRRAPKPSPPSGAPVEQPGETRDREVAGGARKAVIHASGTRGARVVTTPSADRLDPNSEQGGRNAEFLDKLRSSLGVTAEEEPPGP